MEIILLILVIGSFVYSELRIKKVTALIAKLIGDLSDAQMKVVVEYFVEKLRQKNVLREDEIDVFYEELNRKIKAEVKSDVKIF